MSYFKMQDDDGRVWTATSDEEEPISIVEHPDGTWTVSFEDKQ